MANSDNISYNYGYGYGHSGSSNINFAEAESYKKLRTNILFSGKNIKTIVFTSAYPNEGKSEVSFKLASSLAEMGKKVLYVDADLRNSTFLVRHKIRQELFGLAHYLIGEKSYKDVIKKTTVNNLSVTAAGAFPPNPSELLAQDAFKEFIESAKAEFEYIIIDTPPIVPVIDGVIVSAIADGVVLVIESGKVTYHVEKDIIKQLEQANCKVIGAVLNKYPIKSGSAYDNKYGKYGKYGHGPSRNETSGDSQTQELPKVD